LSSVSCQIEGCSELCHACQLGLHVRLPFRVSTSHACSKFDLIHCDLWTFQLSVFLFIDILWLYLMIALTTCGLLLCAVNLTHSARLAHFVAYASTQFGAHVKAVQCDNRKEFDILINLLSFLSHIHLRSFLYMHSIGCNGPWIMNTAISWFSLVVQGMSVWCCMGFLSPILFFLVYWVFEKKFCQQNIIARRMSLSFIVGKE
jgi:hypothetical protein